VLLLQLELVVHLQIADEVCRLGQEDFGLPEDALQLIRAFHLSLLS